MHESVSGFKKKIEIFFDTCHERKILVAYKVLIDIVQFVWLA